MGQLGSLGSPAAKSPGAVAWKVGRVYLGWGPVLLSSERHFGFIYWRI